MPIGYAYFTIGMIALIVFVPYLRHEYFGRIVSMLAYRRGFLNVACPRGKAMRRPGYVGQVTDTDSHAFFVYKRTGRSTRFFNILINGRLIGK